MTKRRNQPDHDSMVQSVVDHIFSNGHSGVKAHISGYETPSKITWKTTGEGHIPDITSKAGSEYLFEVETEDSIDDSHTEDQWSLFSANAKQHSKKFVVVVPEGCGSRAWERAEEIGVTLDDVWTVV